MVYDHPLSFAPIVLLSVYLRHHHVLSPIHPSALLQVTPWYLCIAFRSSFANTLALTPFPSWIGSTYGIGLFWCKEDQTISDMLLTAASCLKTRQWMQGSIMLCLQARWHGLRVVRGTVRGSALSLAPLDVTMLWKVPHILECHLQAPYFGMQTTVLSALTK